MFDKIYKSWKESKQLTEKEVKELVDKIKEYQTAHGLPSFISAVRKLCNDALEIEKIRH